VLAFNVSVSLGFGLWVSIGLPLTLTFGLNIRTSAFYQRHLVDGENWPPNASAEAKNGVSLSLPAKTGVVFY